MNLTVENGQGNSYTAEMVRRDAERNALSSLAFSPTLTELRLSESSLPRVVPSGRILSFNAAEEMPVAAAA